PAVVYILSLHDALPISHCERVAGPGVEHDRLPVEERAQPPAAGAHQHVARRDAGPARGPARGHLRYPQAARPLPPPQVFGTRDVDRKSTRLNSSHEWIS